MLLLEIDTKNLARQFISFEYINDKYMKNVEELYQKTEECLIDHDKTQKWDDIIQLVEDKSEEF